MTRPTEAQLWRELERLKSQLGTDEPPLEVTVEWRLVDDPDPADDGVRYEADPEAGTATLTYDVWHAQQTCLDALGSGEHDIVAFLGGYGSGKTCLGGRWILATALQHPNTNFLAMGKTYSMARHTTFEKLFEQLPGRETARDPERSPIVEKYNKSERYLLLTNGAVIILGSADVYHRYSGAEFGAIWLDEVANYRANLHELLERLDTRFRGTEGPMVQCWTLTGDGYNDAWEILEKRENREGEPQNMQIEVVRASTLDNPFLEEQTRAKFERKYAGTAREEQTLHGGFAAAEGLVYPEFAHGTHVVSHAEALELVEDDWRVYGYDAGWNNPRVLVEIGKTAFDQLVVVDLYYERESHVEDAIAWLQENDKPKGTIYCEHEPSDIEQFESAGFPAVRATKSRDPGISEVRRRLQSDGSGPIYESPAPPRQVVRRSSRREYLEHLENSDAVEKVGPGRYRRTHPQAGRPRRLDRNEGVPDQSGRVGLLVSDRCRPLIREFHSYRTEDVGTDRARDDGLDALRYACMGVAGA